MQLLPVFCGVLLCALVHPQEVISQDCELIVIDASAIAFFQHAVYGIYYNTHRVVIFPIAVHMSGRLLLSGVAELKGVSGV